jgi:phosphopantothenoylcysteine decarboxylase
MNILLGITGSVAAGIVERKLIPQLSKIGEVKTVITEKANYFIENNYNTYQTEITKYLTYHQFEEWKNKYPKIKEDDEWKWKKKGDPVLHITLKDWADVFVIAPLSANTLSKMVNGICDNLLTSIYRAWPMDKPIIIAPAMNTDMWNHPITNEQLNLLDNRHRVFCKYMIGDWPNISNSKHTLDIIWPVAKELACGTTGMGALAPIEEIIKKVNSLVTTT